MKENEKVITMADRRTFLSILPIGVFGAIGVTLASAAHRSLSPGADIVDETSWKSVGEISELTGDTPIEKTVSVTCRSGWIKTVDEVSVFVLPKHENKVLSSVCPHEGCPIVWDEENTKFLCPCHDSFFNDSGERLTGPATKDLKEYEARVENGVLQIKV